MKNILKLSVFFFIFLFFLFGAFFTKKYFDSVNFSQEEYFEKFSEQDKISLGLKNKKVAVNIEMGTPISSVAEILVDKGIIDNKYYFFIYMKLNKLEGKIQAGDFIFDTPIGLKDVFEQIGNSKRKDFRVIIPEGYTIDDIDNVLVKKGLIESGDIKSCAKSCKFPNFNFFYDGNLEGYLFPDTYFVPVDNFTPKNFLERMLRNFENKVLNNELVLNSKSDGKYNGRSFSDIIKMASIVEREELNKNNLSSVAGILWRRIDEGIPIGADATTRYFKKSKKGDLYVDDFKTDNKYNTRKYRGLPPTAISNPGINSIIATIYPNKTKYLFYLHGHDGQIHFAETNDGHNLNKIKYLK